MHLLQILKLREATVWGSSSQLNVFLISQYILQWRCIYNKYSTPRKILVQGGWLLTFDKSQRFSSRHLLCPSGAFCDDWSLNLHFSHVWVLLSGVNKHWLFKALFNLIRKQAFKSIGVTNYCYFKMYPCLFGGTRMRRKLAGCSTMSFARINDWHLLASGVHIPVYLSNHQLLSIRIFIILSLRI